MGEIHKPRYKFVGYHRSKRKPFDRLVQSFLMPDSYYWWTGRRWLILRLLTQ